jgi:K+-transporting ATPase ATPase A chain
MTLSGWLEIGLIFGLVALTARPLGLYMARVFTGERTFLSPVVGPVERGFYAAAGVAPEREQSWLSYTLAMLAFSAAGFVSLYAICGCRLICRLIRRDSTMCRPISPSTPPSAS